jgi:hypothetical protein
MLKKTVTLFLTFFCLLIFLTVVQAEEKVSINGKVKSIDVEKKTVIVTTNEGKDVTITVEDDETLNKLRDGRIGIDDDVRVKYIKKDDKNISTYFRKAAGC